MFNMTEEKRKFIRENWKKEVLADGKITYTNQDNTVMYEEVDLEDGRKGDSFVNLASLKVIKELDK